MANGKGKLGKEVTFRSQVPPLTTARSLFIWKKPTPIDKWYHFGKGLCTLHTVL